MLRGFSIILYHKNCILNKQTTSHAWVRILAIAPFRHFSSEITDARSENDKLLTTDKSRPESTLRSATSPEDLFVARSKLSRSAWIYQKLSTGLPFLTLAVMLAGAPLLAWYFGDYRKTAIKIKKKEKTQFKPPKFFEGTPVDFDRIINTSTNVTLVYTHYGEDSVLHKIYKPIMKKLHALFSKNEIPVEVAIIDLGSLLDENHVEQTHRYKFLCNKLPAKLQPFLHVIIPRSLPDGEAGYVEFTGDLRSYLIEKYHGSKTNDEIGRGVGIDFAVRKLLSFIGSHVPNMLGKIPNTDIQDLEADLCEVTETIFIKEFACEK